MVTGGSWGGGGELVIGLTRPTVRVSKGPTGSLMINK